MKTTIRAHTKDVIVKPSPVAGMIELHLQSKNDPAHGQHVAAVVLTPDQAGALIFGLEQALEANEVAAGRVAV